MNEYYSGDVGKCPFATAAHARETQVSMDALKQFGNLVVNGIGYLLGASIMLALLVAAIAVLMFLCSGAEPLSIIVVAG